MFYSPLRYPGGKNKLAAFIAKICVDNNINGHYVEPYAGGASVALFLLIEGFVNQITINDKDKSIYAFWYSVLNHTEELCQRIITTDITVENWYIQREIQKNKDLATLLDLGFSSLFMNRANRSGIINGGIMGGINQNGTYKIDCRFNKADIISRIRKIVLYKNKINLYQDDAINLIDKIEAESQNENTVFYFDPPYYLKANSLYMNHYKYDDHLAVSQRIKRIKNIKWIVSYDNTPEIQKLYVECSKKEYSFKHTAYRTRIGQEVLFFSKNIIQPLIEDWSPLNFKINISNKQSSLVYKPNNPSLRKIKSVNEGVKIIV
ncbi:MAG: adenine methylase [Pseudomonadota bacterium]|nr:adenine methylase [Pseudomonadota bacterium]